MGTSDILLPILIFSPPVVTGFVAVSALQSGSYLRQAAKSEMVFLAPISTVVFVITMLVWIVCLSIAVNTPHFFLINWRHVLSNPSSITFASALGFVVAGLYWVVIRWYQKHCPLVLDLERRRYRTIDVNSITLKTHTGSWEDVAGIYMNRASARGSVTFYVRLKWKETKRLAAVLGGFSNQEKAEVFAERMAWEIGLPVVASPI